MRASATVVSLVLCLQGVTSFQLSRYAGTNCKGQTEVHEDAKPEDGCQSALFSNYASIINKWASDDDNKYLLVTYSDDKCCHGEAVQQFSWDDDCQEAQLARSYRIIDVDDLTRGKEGEDYICGMDQAAQ